MFLGMDFLTQAKVSILPYLGTLAFIEQGKPCIIMIVREEDTIDYGNFIKLEFSTRLNGG